VAYSEPWHQPIHHNRPAYGPTIPTGSKITCNYPVPLRCCTYKPYTAKIVAGPSEHLTISLVLPGRATKVALAS